MIQALGSAGRSVQTCHRFRPTLSAKNAEEARTEVVEREAWGDEHRRLRDSLPPIPGSNGRQRQHGWLITLGRGCNSRRLHFF